MKKKEPFWILERVVLAAHSRLLAVHGGAEGLRDSGLLQSALARPRQHYSYSSPDIIELAALYTAALVRNHPFVDGNKRTGFAIGVAFLELNGFVLQAAETDATQAVLALATGDIDEAGYGAWLRSNSKRAKPRRK
ncbi:MAG TPA: type II toxin-antitoxin system death-on-curing family toxin [Terriglobales bacterium]|jgi:death-on-curing protein|nr:type II toxin-antitoxin system death-on-curing family toxin [Terriglobales bacterium]